MKITVTNLKKIMTHFLKNRQIYGEFTAAIHGQIMLIKHATETVYTILYYTIFQTFTELNYHH